MASRDTQTWIEPALSAYIALRANPKPDDVQRALVDATASSTGQASGMQISPAQGALMGLLAGIVEPTFAVEIGTFTGYSGLCIARALAPNGRLLCCDVSEQWTAIAEQHWEAAGVRDRIDLRIAPALETLAALSEDTVIDLVFIDADKTNYGNYYEAVLPKVRPNGLIIVDNTIWSGKVLAPATADDDNTLALQRFNDALGTDDRVDSYLLPVGDGVTLIRKR